MEDFLDKMKKSLEEGKFNSEIADRINQIDKKADEFQGKSTTEMEDDLKKRMEVHGGIKEGSDSDGIKDDGSEAMDYMETVQLQNEIGVWVAHIMSIDTDITNNIVSLKNKIQEVKQKYGDHKEKFVDLFSKIEELENKYNVIKF